MQYLGHVYTKIVFIAYLNFKHTDYLVFYLATLILNLLNMYHLWFNEKVKKKDMYCGICQGYIVLEGNIKLSK